MSQNPLLFLTVFQWSIELIKIAFAQKKCQTLLTIILTLAWFLTSAKTTVEGLKSASSSAFNISKNFVLKSCTRPLFLTVTKYLKQWMQVEFQCQKSILPINFGRICCELRQKLISFYFQETNSARAGHVPIYWIEHIQLTIASQLTHNVVSTFI